MWGQNEENLGAKTRMGFKKKLHTLFLLCIFLVLCFLGRFRAFPDFPVSYFPSFTLFLYPFKDIWRVNDGNVTTIYHFKDNERVTDGDI